MENKIKIVVVGDGAVGKSCLLQTFMTNKFPVDYVPTIFDPYYPTMEVDKQSYYLDLCDTAGQPEYDKLRVLAYPGTDVFLVCFSIVDPTSFDNVKIKWYPELAQHIPNIPIILVGTKLDLRTDSKFLAELKANGQSLVSYEQGVEMARVGGAVKYMECSALNQMNLRSVFEEAVRAAVNDNKKKNDSHNSEHKNRGCLIS